MWAEAERGPLLEEAAGDVVPSLSDANAAETGLGMIFSEKLDLHTSALMLSVGVAMVEAVDR